MYRLLFVVFLVATQSIHAQVAYNTSCGAAKFLSSASADTLVSFTSQPNCVSGQVKLYYYYRVESFNVSDTVLKIAAKNGTTPVSSSYKVFGPFNSKTKGCDSLGAYTLTPLTTGSGTINYPQHILNTGKVYVLELVVNSCTADVDIDVLTTKLSSSWESTECQTCIPNFQPMAGQYVVSAWVRDALANRMDTTLVKPSIDISDGSTTVNCTGSGDIIDGWQRIEKIITLNSGAASNFSLTMKCASGGQCYFDDIRVFPLDGSMVTYVYDPVSLRLMAELDERNYAKLYEYDEEGKLIRVKKETENGIMTIQENRENNSDK